MKKQIFDDQHQPMPSWLDKLAVDEASGITDADLKGEDVVEKTAATYDGITSTWNKDHKIESETLNDSSRRVANRPVPKASLDTIEKNARKLLMTGVRLEKVASILKHRFEKDALDSFNTERFISLEKEYGKLGCIYVDASLVDDCGDLSDIIKTSGKVSSIAIRDVKKVAKCDDCNFNKRSHCLKLGLNIVDEPQIKTAKEAKSLINKFASLKYVNSYFVKADDLTVYYNRLASENPEKVVQDFLVDVNTRRHAKQNVDSRLAAIETEAGKIENRSRVIKIGKDDTEVANAFKQFLVTDQSLRSAKSTLMKRYGSERIIGYIKEAHDELNKYIKFISAKSKVFNKVADGAHETSSAGLQNKQSSAKVASATRAAYSLRTFRQPVNEIRKIVARTYGDEIAEHVISKLANDKEARLLGVTYIDSNLYSNPSEMKDVINILRRKNSSIICQVKEGSCCRLEDNPEHICSVTGMKIVKNASIDSKDKAIQMIDHLKSVKFANEFELNKLAASLQDGDNTDLIASFITSRKISKMLPKTLVKQATDVALKYAKDLSNIRRIAHMPWSSSNLLVEALESQVINKNAFKDDVKKVLDKSASDANAYLSQPNQYTSDVFSKDKERVSDVILGKTI